MAAVKKTPTSSRQDEVRRLLRAFGVSAHVGDRDVVIDTTGRRELAWAAAHLLRAKHPAAVLRSIGDKIYVINYARQ